MSDLSRASEDYDPATSDALLLQYRLCVGHLELFLEWRHKIMLRMGAIVGATVLIANWFYARDNTEPRWGTAAVLLGGALIAMLTALMEVRNADLILRLREQVFELEGRLGGLSTFENVYNGPALARYESEPMHGLRDRIRDVSRYGRLVWLINTAAVLLLSVLAIASLVYSY